ncbi:hypothetical protein SAMN05216246_10581 [Actinomyces denticolens]|uniref:ABC-2 type transport system permease protein n=1 Tax=Actinomyces denticolens TaxID=52767 RepID=A0ABY1I9H9_9ACTO|nr:hypothetical protein [Actinomyces denticolens]SHI80918.1 hypothetical protein SAMN05216246_10581 [Actinomyces denticolens]
MILLVARTTVVELLRRRAALSLTCLLPLAFFAVRMDTHWTALRLLSMGLGWAVATLALFTHVSSRGIDRRLAVAGAPPLALLAGRLLAVPALGWALSCAYSIVAITTIGGSLERPTAVLPLLLLGATVAAPLGALVAALVPRDLEGALLLIGVMAVQLLVDPQETWTRVLPLWSARELASLAVGPVADASGTLARGIAHAVIYTAVLLVVSGALGWRRLRVVPAAAPAPA